MTRILLILAFIAVEVFAVTHWVAHSRSETPGGLSRWLWLLVILIVPLVGPTAWLGSYVVMRAEKIQREKYAKDSYYQRPPDDNPEEIARVAERLRRRLGEQIQDTRPKPSNQDTQPPTSPEAKPSTPAEESDEEANPQN